MRQTTRRKFMVIGATLLGAGTVGEQAVRRVQTEQSQPPEPPLNAEDIVIQEADLNVYMYDEGDWDAEAMIDLKNQSDERGYSVNIPVYIIDEEGDQLDEIKKIETSLPPGGTTTVKEVWDDADSKVKGGEELVFERVTVRSRKLLKQDYSDTNEDVNEVSNE